MTNSPDISSESSIKRRLLASFGANTFGRVSTTLIQIVSVPLFLSHWGTSLYGEWLLLIAVPGYFSLSDIGFGSVAGNEMTMLVGAKQLDDALEVFQSVWVLTTTLSCTCGFILLGCIWFVPLNEWLHLTIMTARDVRLVILFLGLSVLLSMQETLLQAAFRCVGRYAYGTNIKNIIGLAVFSVALLPLTLGFPPSTVALVQMLGNAVGTIVIAVLLRREIPWIRFGVNRARARVIRQLAAPAISMMSIPISNALSLQGMVVVIGHLLGPVAVVTFSTARTIARSANQVMNLVNNSVWPEISSAFGAGNLDLARRLHRRACQLSVIFCVTIAAVIAVLGEHIWQFWTVGHVVTDPILLYIMLFQLIVSSFWFTSSVIPIAINRIGSMAKVLVFTSALSLCIAWMAMKVPSLGLRGAAAAVVIADLLNTAFVLRISLHLLDDNFRDFLRSMFRVPKLRMP